MSLLKPLDDEILRYLRGELPPSDAARIEAWIASKPESMTFLDRIHSPKRETRDDNAKSERTSKDPARDAPEQIGNYRLISQLGQGGMGTIWLAEQRGPVRRTVAIKLIRPGMDSHQVLARFETERQTLALLDHPNIARVYDGGLTDRGYPYFVMELIKGVPLTKYCDTHKLSVKERIQLFTTVCRAVQHAHQKGIIHRDLKPSNILVERKDGVAVPKIIDFGLAKAMYHKLTELTLHTQMGMLLGTVEYMSPEQAGASPWDVDTRSDIYSLGVILYELLTGTSPLTKGLVKSKPLDEVLLLIRENDPPLPSSRLSGSHDATIIAERREKDLQHLRKHLTGDLDSVTMKALEKDPNRRYETALGLAVDLERYLQNEPVLASAPSRLYKAKKFIRRNRTAVIAATLAFAGLAVGTTLAVVGMIQAREAARTAIADQQRAETAEKEAAREAATAREAESRARISAEEANKQAKLARAGEDAASRERNKAEQIAQALSGLFVAVDPIGINGYTSLIRKPVGESLTPVDLLRQMSDSLKKDNEMDKEVKFALLIRIAIAAMNHSESELAESSINQASDLAKGHFQANGPEMAEARHFTAQIDELHGRYRQAEKHYREALAMRTALVANSLSEKLKRKARIDLSLTQLTFSMLLSQLDNLREAEPLARQALAPRLELLGPDSKETAIARLYLALCLVGNAEVLKKLEGVSLTAQGKKFFEANEGASSMVRAAYSFQEGVFADALNNRKEAIAKIKDSLEATRKIVGPRHPYFMFVQGQLGWMLGNYEQDEEAYKILNETLALAEGLRFLTHPKVLYAYHVLMNVSWRLGRGPEMEARLNKWLAIHEKADPKSIYYADAMMLSALNDFKAHHMERGIKRIDAALDLLRISPNNFKREVTRGLLSQAAKVAVDEHGYVEAEKIIAAWQPWEEKFGSSKMQLEARYLLLLSLLNRGESNERVSELLDRVDRDSNKITSDNKHAALKVLILHSQYQANKKRWDQAEVYLSQAELQARDSSDWYLVAVQAAYLNSQSPSDTRANRAVVSLGKAVDAGLKNKVMIDKEPAFQSIRNRDDFKTIISRIKPNGKGA